MGGAGKGGQPSRKYLGNSLRNLPRNISGNVSTPATSQFSGKYLGNSSRNPPRNTSRNVSTPKHGAPPTPSLTKAKNQEAKEQARKEGNRQETRKRKRTSFVANSTEKNTTKRTELAGEKEQKMHCAFVHEHGQPKSGTTWLHFVLLKIAKYSCDEEGGTKCVRPDMEAFPPFYHKKHELFPYRAIGGDNFQRLAPTHVLRQKAARSELRSFIEKLNKSRGCIVGLLRDPRDIVISGCHYFQKACAPDQYMRSELGYAVSWTALRWEVYSRVAEALPGRMFILFYQDLRQRFVPVVQRLSQQLGMPLAEQKVHRVENETSVAKMQLSEKAGFVPNIKWLPRGVVKVRKGEVCGFLSEVSPRTAAWAAKEMEKAHLPSELAEKLSCLPVNDSLFVALRFFGLYS